MYALATRSAWRRQSEKDRRRLAWCIRRCTNDAAASLGGKHGQGFPRRGLVLTEVRTVRSSYEASRCFNAVRVPGFALIFRQTPFSSYDSLSTWTFLRMSASTPSLP